MPENEWAHESGYSGLMHNGMRRMISEVVEKHGKRKLGCRIEDISEGVAMVLFKKVYEGDKKNVY